MKKILLPTDFTELGEFAYGIANVLSTNTNAEITALSIVPGPQGAYYTKSGNLINDEGNDYSEWEKKLDSNKLKMQEWIKGKSNITDTCCIIGNVDKSILSFSEAGTYDLIIMGTDGVFDKSVWTPGSHTEFVANNSEIPVLSLKCDRSNLDLSQIVLVSDFLEKKKCNLAVIKNIQEAYNSEITLLKINTKHKKRSDDQITHDMEAFAEINALENYKIETYNDESVEGGIGKFCAERGIALIALGNHQGKGFSKLFHKSISDDIVNHLFHPIITFPLK